MVWNQILQCKNIILIVGEQSVMVDDSNSKNFLFEYHGTALEESYG